MPNSSMPTSRCSRATLPYLLDVAVHGARGAAARSEAIRRGVNVVAGSVTYAPVAEELGYATADALVALGAA